MRFISLYSITDQALRNLVDSYSLMYSILVLSFSTHYLNIQDHTNTVIDLLFLDISYSQVFYCIEPNLRQLSDYNSFIVDLSITPENICIYKIVLKYNSKEKVAFLLSISEDVKIVDSRLYFYFSLCILFYFSFYFYF